MTRYLAAFGPASVRDVQTWSGLTGLREVADRLRPGLRTFLDENGTELLDLPDAPRPAPDTPAPARLVAEFDNLILSHADRSRVIDEQARARIFTPNGVFPGTVLVNGFVAGTWRIDRSAGAATLTVEPFGKMTVKDRDAVRAEAGRLLAFAAPGAAHDVRFGPAGERSAERAQARPPEPVRAVAAAGAGGELGDRLAHLLGGEHRAHLAPEGLGVGALPGGVGGDRGRAQLRGRGQLRQHRDEPDAERAPLGLVRGVEVRNRIVALAPA